MLFLSFVAWYFASRVLAMSAASGLAFRFRLVTGRLLLHSCFHLFLLIIGFTVLERVARRIPRISGMMGLPKRHTAQREWLTGLALGWGMVVAALLPVVLLGRVHTVFTLGWNELGDACIALAVLLVSALTHEITFRGHPFQCLIDAIGQTPAMILVTLGAGLSAWHNAWVPGTAVLGSMLLTLLLSLSWFRTHAIWLAWGLHFGLVGFGSVIFGLSLGDGGGFSTLVRSSVLGADWLTGGSFGPAGAVFSIFVLLAAVPVLYRVSRDYAWHYTHTPIVAGGHEVTIAPPQAHAAMERNTPQALVQILPTTSTSFSAGAAGEATEKR